MQLPPPDRSRRTLQLPLRGGNLATTSTAEGCATACLTYGLYLPRPLGLYMNQAYLAWGLGPGEAGRCLMAQFKKALIFKATWRPGPGGRGLLKFWPLAPL